MSRVKKKEGDSVGLFSVSSIRKGKEGRVIELSESTVSKESR